MPAISGDALNTTILACIAFFAAHRVENQSKQGGEKKYFFYLHVNSVSVNIIFNCKDKNPFDASKPDMLLIGAAGN